MKNSFILILVLYPTLVFGQVICPSIFMQPPSEVDICDGETRHISFNVLGFGDLSYQWWARADGEEFGFELDNGGGLSGVHTTILTIDTDEADWLSNPDTSPHVFNCVITSDGCSPLWTDDVTVTILPSHTQSPSTIGASGCGPQSFELSASGPGGFSYAWYTSSTGGTSINSGSTYNTPVLSSTTTYYVALENSNGCDGPREPVTATINNIPNAPGTSGAARCGNGSVTVTATGGSNGQYRWYPQPSGGPPISGETGNSYSTPALGSSTTYYVAINNGTCEGERSEVQAVINAIPDPPLINVDGSTNICIGDNITLSGPSGFSTYQWSTGDYTQAITVTDAGDYTLQVIDNNGCMSEASDVVSVTTEDCNNNLPPAIAPEETTTEIGGVAMFSLLDLLTDPDDNIDLSSLEVIEQPHSGALAIIDVNYNLIVDYTGVSFSGTDKLSIRVCDFSGSCTAEEFTIEVTGDVVVYNAISPNGDGKNDYLLILYIDVFEETKKNRVSIYNRWGTEVFQVNNYDNVTNVFYGLSKNGKELPTGTYFYKIEFASGKEGKTGYISLRR